MDDLIVRTEDIRPSRILEYYVETKRDKEIVESLKSRSPVLLEGSRGVGKSFLLRVAERQLLDSLDEKGVIPVYVPLTKSILLNTSNEDQFHYWVLARLSSSFLRTLRKQGLTVGMSREVNTLGGRETEDDPINEVIREFEQSYRNPGQDIDISEVPGVIDFQYAVEDICDSLGLERVCVFFDEAAHVLQPRHQRQFFTLFRDLRTSYISCNAAVYPGVTSYGETFERTHDATIERVERDVTKSSYLEEMKEIISAQSDSSKLVKIERRESQFKALAYAASGNPRFLLKTLSMSPDLKNISSTIKQYYRNDVWAEHRRMSEKFTGLEKLTEWGDYFIRDEVLPRIHNKNEGNTDKTNRYFWIRDGAPTFVYKSIQLLMYAGIVSLDKESIVGTNDWIGTRYAVNLGILFSDASLSVSDCITISENLSVSNPVLFNRNHSVFSEIDAEEVVFTGQDSDVLDDMLSRSVDNLDLTDFKKKRIREQGLNTIRDVLESSEDLLKKGYYVGDVRAQKIHNAAQAAVMEYLQG